MISVPLHQKPTIRQAGSSVHGQRPRAVYMLPDHWCLHIYTYEADLWVDGEHFAIQPGRITLVPPGAQLEYHFQGLSRHLYAHFRMPESSQDLSSFQVMTDEPKHTPRLREMMYEVIRRLPVNRLRADLLFWDLLWELEGIQPQHQTSETTLHPVFEEARSLIELRLEESVSVADLAKELEISHNQLTRIFRKETGKTVAAYLQTRRAVRAEHLLRDTSLPIKSIGYQVGYPDPQHFNKFIHRALGTSPSEIRSGG